jgi:sorting nexin-25
MFLEESYLISFINIFKSSMWPGGKLKAPGVPRTNEERLQTRDDANRKLSALIPGMQSPITRRIFHN